MAITGFSFSQSAGSDPDSAYLAMLQNGIQLYSQGKWDESIIQLRTAQASSNKTLAGEALFWIAMAELSAGNYQKTVDDIAALETLDPNSIRINELSYQKGRALYYLGQYNDAIVAFTKYTDSFDPDPLLSPQDLSKKAAAYYWIGESLYAMGQLDRAGDVFTLITKNYPDSSKYEVSSYRIALINQKKIETELLGLLKYSHEESLRIMEEYQRRETAYDQAILSYQKRINDMLKDTRLADLETANAQYQDQLAAAEDRIRTLEDKLAQTSGLASGQQNADNSAARLQALRSSASAMLDELQQSSGNAGGTSK